jgi:hypothetical protein
VLDGYGGFGYKGIADNRKLQIHEYPLPEREGIFYFKFQITDCRLKQFEICNVKFEI